MQLLITLLLAFTPSVFVFPDTETNTYKNYIHHLEDRGIVEGDPDGRFRPQRLINRAEFLKIVTLAAFGDEARASVERKCFTDFTGEEQWYWSTACSAKEQGIIHGYPNGTFKGDDPVNQVEALKMIFRAWKIPEPVFIRPPDHWYDPYVIVANERGVFSVIPFRPDRELTRGEAAALLVSFGEEIATLVEMEEEKPFDFVGALRPKRPPTCGNGTLEQGEQCDDGNLAIGDGCSDLCIIVTEPVRHGALRIEQRAYGDDTIVAGARNILLLQFEAVAGRQDVYLTTLKFTSEVGSLNIASNFRLYVDIDRDGEAETEMGAASGQGEFITFAPLNILLQEGSLVRFDVRGDIISSAQAGEKIGLGFSTSEPDTVEGVDRYDGEDVTGFVLNGGDCTLQSICWIRLFTANPRTLTVAGSGSITVE